MPILLIDADPVLGRVLRQGLVLARFTVDWVTDASTALRLAGAHAHDIVLLRSSGFSVDAPAYLRALRSCGLSASITLLDTGMGSESRIAALDAGADDCLVEPFEIQELLARIRAAIRRGFGSAVPEIVMGSLRFDLLYREAFYGDRRVDLTATELDLLEALMRNVDRPLAKERLGQLIYRTVDPRASNAVQVHLHNLRQKLRPGAINNVRGKGYRLDPDSDCTRVT